MQYSDKPYVELERARNAIEAMRRTESLDELEDHWKEYLRRLERVWNKAENHFRKSPKWDSWGGKFKTIRRKDALLAYLINARGADEHTIAEITQRQRGRVTVDAGQSGVLHVKHMRTDEHGRVVDVDVVGDAVVRFHPAQVKLLPVTNRGIVYEAPREHLLRPVDPENLVDIAERGVAFYSDFLNQAEAYFIESTRAKR